MPVLLFLIGHDVHNLFIVDGSLFVTCIGVNPTGTVQTLALTIAASMKKNLVNPSIEILHLRQVKGAMLRGIKLE